MTILFIFDFKNFIYPFWSKFHADYEDDDDDDDGSCLKCFVIILLYIFVAYYSIIIKIIIEIDPSETKFKSLLAIQSEWQ